MKMRSFINKKVAKNVGFFRFRKINNTYFLSNDFGLYIFLTPDQFDKFIQGKINAKSNVYTELIEKGFTNKAPAYKEKELIEIYEMKNKYLFNSGPSLHIVVMTSRCNYNCIYCHAGSKNTSLKDLDMKKETAKKIVDFIFKTPSPHLTIEFQGGEPLINWPVVKFIIEYARKKAQEEQKILRLALVSNLSLMTDQKLDFLLKNKVDICTSLDGPEKIHNKNRPCHNKNSYKETTKWIGKITKKSAKIGALITVTKFTFQDLRGVVDEYVRQGFTSMHFRYLNYLGTAKKSQNKIGYSADEFIDAWKKIMDYIILINKEGKCFWERESQIILKKILTYQKVDYVDLRSPCGAVLGQMLYNYDGKIYTCDEGRMLKDDTFLIGDVNTNNYESIIAGGKTKTMLVASCLENLSCDFCAYKPYCGVCPVKHYAYYGNLFPYMQSTDFCKIKMAQFEYLFEKIQDEEIKKIFIRWTVS